MNKFIQLGKNVVTKFGASVLCLLLITFNAFAADTSRPTVPRNLTAKSLSEIRIDLAWDSARDNVGVSFYRILRDDVEIATSTVITFSDSNLSPGVSYSYKIQAEDAEGNVSNFSRNVTATTLDFTSPLPPGNVSANPISEIRVDIAWDPSMENDAVDRYFVFRDGIEIAESSSTSYIDRSLAAGTVYTYWVEADDEAGNRSNPSEVVTATTLDSTSPTAPESLIATPKSETRVTLTWDVAIDNVGIKQYHIYRNNVLIASTVRNRFFDSDVSADTSYSYRVQAEDTSGNLSSKSATVVTITPDITPPTSPQNLTATPQSEFKIDLQ